LKTAITDKCGKAGTPRASPALKRARLALEPSQVAQSPALFAGHLHCSRGEGVGARVAEARRWLRNYHKLKGGDRGDLPNSIMTVHSGRHQARGGSSMIESRASS
jgi:hypothetical protein